MAAAYRNEDANFLQFCYREIWSAAGASDEHADVMGRCISHGDRMAKQVQGLPVFQFPIDMLKSGNLDIKAVPEVVAEGPSWLVLDGKRSSGQWAVATATDRAIDKARVTGAAIALGRNHNDTGCFSAYTAQAIEQGMIGLGSNGGGKGVAPWGGMEKALTLPPLAISAPGGETSLPLVTDVFFVEFPPDSVPTAIPHHHMDHRIMDSFRISHPRNYALTCALEVLTSVMVPGGHMPADLPAWPDDLWDEPQEKSSNGGSFMLVIDFSHFMDMSEYRKKMDRYVASIKSVKKMPGVDEILLPGERGLQREREGRPIPFLEADFEWLSGVASEFGRGIDELRAMWTERESQTA